MTGLPLLRSETVAEVRAVRARFSCEADSAISGRCHRVPVIFIGQITAIDAHPPSMDGLDAQPGIQQRVGWNRKVRIFT